MKKPAISALSFLKSNPRASAAELETALQSAREELGETEKLLDSARERYDASLLNDDHKTTVAANDAVTAGVILLDRAKKAVEIAEQRLAEARRDEAEASRLASYEAAAQKIAAADKRLRKDWARLCGELLQLVAEAADAMASAEDSNRNLPTGRSPIELPPSLTRSLPRREEEIIERKSVRLWAYENGKPVPAQQAVVRVRGAEGVIETQGRSGRNIPVLERDFFELTYKAAEPRGVEVPLWTQVALPALYDWQLPFWTGGDAYPDTIAEQIASSLALKRAAAPPDDRPVMKRLEPM